MELDTRLHRSNYIKYTAGYKYQLWEEYRTILDPKMFDLKEFPEVNNLPFISLQKDGKLVIKKGYAWDGPSGITYDTATFMRGSLVHDALYQLMRWNRLPLSCRKGADDLLKIMSLKDGMWGMRASWVHKALRKGGRKAALPSAVKRVHRAP